MAKLISSSLIRFLFVCAALNDLAHCDASKCGICSAGGEINPNAELKETDFGKYKPWFNTWKGTIGKDTLKCGDIETLTPELCGKFKFLAEACECPGATGCDISCPEGRSLDENYVITDTLTCNDVEQTGSIFGNLCIDVNKKNFTDHCCRLPQTRSSLRQADLDNFTDTIDDLDIELVECSICPDGWSPDEDRVILGLEGLTCGDIVTIGSLSEEVCAEINEVNGNIDWACGCPGVERPSCTACPDGMPVLNLERKLTKLGDLPITCAQAEEMALLRCSDNESDNQELQAIVAEECGCGYAPTVPPMEPPTEAPVEPEPSSLKMADGAIVGIVIGAAVLELIILAVYFSYRKKNNEESEN